MFTQTWNKYLPIIKILMKRSVNGPQSLNMNQTDFQRAAAGRKVKYSFTISLHMGRIQNITNPPPLAKELATILSEDEVTRDLTRRQDYEFILNSSFQLTIKNNTPPAEGSTATPDESENGDKLDHAETNSSAPA